MNITAPTIEEELTSVPTIEEELASVAGPCGTYHWDVEGGRVGVTLENLRSAMEMAYDPNMPNWPALVETYLIV